MGTAAPTGSREHLQNVLAHIQSLCAKAYEEGTSNKHQQIRVTHWVRKLRNQPASNPTWLKNVLEHANLLHLMIQDGLVEEPFTKMPPQGPLAGLPRHQVARLHVSSAKRTTRAQPAQSSSKIHSALEIQRPINNNIGEKVQNATMVSRQIQTQEQDDQWEWQRVWKGAFGKMHQQLQGKTEKTEILETENKELRALVAGYQKAKEESERNHRDVAFKHRAEIENMRKAHSIELSDVQFRHRKKLQEVRLQNEKIMKRRRQTVSKNLTPRGAHAYGNAEFLQYIDEFYTSTLQLTAQNQCQPNL